MDLGSALNQYLGAALEVVLIILAIFGSYLASRATMAVRNQITDEQYNTALKVAQGLYVALEDEFQGVANAGKQKAAEMFDRLSYLFPALTTIELEAINKTVWEEFNMHYHSFLTETEEEETKDGTYVYVAPTAEDMPVDAELETLNE